MSVSVKATGEDLVETSDRWLSGHLFVGQVLPWRNSVTKKISEFSSLLPPRRHSVSDRSFSLGVSAP
jgi:hypothetical protein